ncbi:MAG: undecaprenyl-diphosphate phosphatase [Holophagales bacterium]|nr:undecaprenyl-diphosphate phosphatase [Holophagales bacterium]MYG30316.1 undecaprenyl-diphosphate phosphatase [Holophagales bacterium]MYI80941.1 undecaprenyl-diphosphate phosphatase [Holophagales bacterium]
MGPLQLILVALVQGLTEYLPISSTAHLILLPRLFGWEDQGLAVDVAANTGTLLAVIAYFRKDLAGYVRALFHGGEDGDRDGSQGARRMIPLLALASLPVLVVGIAAGDWIAGDARSPALIAWATIGFGLVLGVADRWGRQKRRLEQVNWWNALVFGLAQATALIPGASRAGVVISAGRLLGFDRESSARFAFLLALPVGVFVAGKDSLDLVRGALPLSQLPSLLLVAALSAVVGYLVIGGLLGWLRRRSLQVFVGYRLALGVVLLLVF